MTSEQTTPSKKITVGLIFSWIFGILFALIGITSVFSEQIPGIVMLVMAAVLLPPVNKLVDEKWKFHLSGGIKIVLIIIGFVIFESTIKTPESIKQQDNQLQIQQSQEQPISKTEQLEEKAETPKEDPAPEPSETISQKNAVRKAKSYLGYSSFSHGGLIDQLKYEQFLHSDAVYGADNSGANWNEQAAKKAKSYMAYSAFSRGSLIEQLKYDKFTQSQAEYGANAVGL